MLDGDTTLRSFSDFVRRELFPEGKRPFRFENMRLKVKGLWRNLGSTCMNTDTDVGAGAEWRHGKF